MKHKFISLILCLFLLVTISGLGAAQQTDISEWDENSLVDTNIPIYLPTVIRPAPPPPAPLRRVNVPLPTDFEPGTTMNFSKAAVFWFGRISSSENYADVRMYATYETLYVRVSIFDRYLWNSTTPSPTNLLAYDAVSLLIDLDNGRNELPTRNSYRFDAQVFDTTRSINLMPNYQAGYRGNGSSWVFDSVNFVAASGPDWEVNGGGVNNGASNRGWSVIYEIPFNSLGLNGTPAEGMEWRLGVVVYDRESPQESVLDVKSWPEQLNFQRPTSWGLLHFGLPEFAPPNVPISGQITVQEGLNNAYIPDASVGNADSLCAENLPNISEAIWNIWPNLNFGERAQVNVQNQANLADWPCFSKYYVTFPLNQIPSGKVILNAELSLYLFGNANPTLAQRSLVQVLRVREAWQENVITWNNAPLAVENIAQNYVYPTNEPVIRIKYTWDVSRGVAQAYADGEPLQLVLYSADGALHSGKYFVSSEDNDDFLNGMIYRPALDITWGDP